LDLFFYVTSIDFHGDADEILYGLAARPSSISANSVSPDRTSILGGWMNSLPEPARNRTQIHLADDRTASGWRRAIVVFVCIAFSCVFASCSSQTSSQPAASIQTAQPSAKSGSPSAALPDADLKSKSPEELAAYIFEHHGCNNCHTMGNDGKLGFTDRGKEIGKGFEGCISMLTSMNVIAQIKAEHRSASEELTAARFEQFGCTTCHQITPGKLGLTEYGSKLASMHLACTDVQKILAKK
jgi:cytochrome c551/c552